MVPIGYIVTAVGLYNLTRLDLDTSFAQVTLWRMLQVVGLPFIFIPISTLNYVGVPRDKTNQISSASPTSRATSAAAWAPRCSPLFSRAAPRFTSRASPPCRPRQRSSTASSWRRPRPA